MNKITLKGLLFRMMIAFAVTTAVLYVYPAHAGTYNPYAPADTIAQSHYGLLPPAPNAEQHQKTQERVMLLRAMHPVEADAIGNIRPMAPDNNRLQAPAFGEWDTQAKE